MAWEPIRGLANLITKRHDVAKTLPLWASIRAPRQRSLSYPERSQLSKATEAYGKRWLISPYNSGKVLNCVQSKGSLLTDLNAHVGRTIQLRHREVSAVPQGNALELQAPGTSAR